MGSKTEDKLLKEMKKMDIPRCSPHFLFYSPNGRVRLRPVRPARGPARRLTRRARAGNLFWRRMTENSVQSDSINVERTKILPTRYSKCHHHCHRHRLGTTQHNTTQHNTTQQTNLSLSRGKMSSMDELDEQLLDAARDGHVDDVARLLRQGANIDAVDK